MVELTKQQSEFLSLLPALRDINIWGLDSAYIRDRVRKLQKKAQFRSSSS